MKVHYKNEWVILTFTPSRENYIQSSFFGLQLIIIEMIISNCKYQLLKFPDLKTYNCLIYLTTLFRRNQQNKAKKMTIMAEAGGYELMIHCT